MPVITKEITHVGAFLRDIRVRRDILQQQVAEILGITQSNYSRMEHGLNGVSLRQAQILCDLWDIPSQELINMQRLDTKDKRT